MDKATKGEFHKVSPQQPRSDQSGSGPQWGGNQPFAAFFLSPQFHFVTTSQQKSFSTSIVSFFSLLLLLLPSSSLAAVKWAQAQ
jgi:hypothetical protein